MLSLTKLPEKVSTGCSLCRIYVNSAAPTSVASDMRYVITRVRSVRNRSTMRITQAMESTKLSGRAGDLAGMLNPLGASSCLMKLFAFRPVGQSQLLFRYLDVLQQRVHRGVQHVHHRRRPHAKQQDHDGERTQHEALAAVDVLERRDAFVLHLTEQHALHEPQGVGGAEHQCRAREEGEPEIRL